MPEMNEDKTRKIAETLQTLGVGIYKTTKHYWREQSGKEKDREIEKLLTLCESALMDLDAASPDYSSVVAKEKKWEKDNSWFFENAVDTNDDKMEFDYDGRAMVRDIPELCDTVDHMKINDLLEMFLEGVTLVKVVFCLVPLLGHRLRAAEQADLLSRDQLSQLEEASREVFEFLRNLALAVQEYE